MAAALDVASLDEMRDAGALSPRSQRERKRARLGIKTDDSTSYSPSPSPHPTPLTSPFERDAEEVCKACFRDSVFARVFPSSCGCCLGAVRGLVFGMCALRLVMLSPDSPQMR